MKNILLVTLTTITFIACGPSKAELEASEKIKMDSVANATANNISRQKAVQDSIDDSNMNQQTLKQQLVELKSQLESEQVKLADVEKFKILRTADEKAQQIQEQSKIVEELKVQILEIEKQIIQ